MTVAGIRSERGVRASSRTRARAHAYLVWPLARSPAATPARLARAAALAWALACGAAAPALAAPAPGTPIDNTASATALDATGVPFALGSNTVTTIVQAATLPALAFFDAPDYQRLTRVSPLTSALHVQADARGCDLDPARIETVPLTLRSRLTGDFETFMADETAPASGLFRIPSGATTAPGPGTSAAGDGVLTILRGDLVTAELPGCGAAITTATVWIEPTSLVYESRTDAPVGGVNVRLVDVSGQGNGGVPGGPAVVFAGDGVTPAPAQVVTDPQGRFSFPLVPRSTYRLEVSPPQPWRFPSRMGLSGLPPGHLTDPSGSYGGAFTPVDSLAPVGVDVPVDLVGTIALFVEHTASRPEVEWGDELEYTIRVANRSDSALARVTLHERLPAGFAYQRGTARGGRVPAGGGTASLAPLAVDAAGSGPALAFDLGPLGAQETHELRLRARVRAGAAPGEALAVAQAIASNGTASNQAPARVRVRGDVFADEGGIVGTVFVQSADRPASRADDTSPGAAGLAGVRVFLDDGTWAVTDARGRFSFTGVTPRTHALKLDRTTLPPRAVPVALDRRGAGTPGLRFVDLTRGELARADFAVAGDTSTLREAQERRVAALPRDEASRALARAVLRPEQRSLAHDARSLPASAIVTGEREPGAGATPAHAAHASAPVAPVVALASLEQLLPTLDPELGFVGLSDLDTVAVHQVAVRVKGRYGTPLLLRLNGERVPESRVGRRVTALAAGLEAWEYVGVPLRPGVNVLELATPHAQGRVAVRIVAPASFAALGVSAPRSAPADGLHPVPVAVAVLDSAGVPVGARTLVTLESTLGQLAAPDLDPARAGVQVAIEGGRAIVPLVPPGSPGRARVTAACGTFTAAVDVEFVPELRPLLVVGALEGLVSLEGVRHASGGRAPRTGFEQPLGQFLAESRDGRRSAGARAGLFVKGRVRDDMQLTLGYDSDRPDDLRRFRDMTPDRGYPVQGDASVRGYEAQSTGRLYARLDRKDATLLYGDLTTGGMGAIAGAPGGMAGGASPSLSQYARSLTGAAALWGDERRGLRAFTSRERSRAVVDEIPARGVSGPYLLSRAPILEQSERVEVLVRRRDQPAVVVSSEVRQRFTDYELDPLTGGLLFRAPVPSLDPGLNPVSIRVTYEVRGGGEPAWVHGVQLHERVSPRLDVAGTYVDDHDPTQPFELRGASARVELGPRTRLESEWAVTRRGPGGPGPAAEGDAGRLELRHEGARMQARLWGMSAASGFTNPGAGLAGGRAEAGGRFAARLAERTRLTAEALYSADAGGGTRRGGLLTSLDRMLSPAWRGEIGMRVAGESRAAGGEEPLLTTLRARLLGQWPSRPEWSGYGEVEQDLQQGARRVLALGGEYRFNARGRAYARHELASSISGPWALSGGQERLATVAGVDASLAAEAHLFSEYRLADALAGRDAQAAVGLRNAWRLASGMRVGGAFERVSPLAGPRSAEGPSTALAGSLDWSEDPVWKGSARMEIRSSRAADQILQTMAAAVKLDSSWTGLFRHALSFGGSLTATGREAREHLQAAFAYRDAGAARLGTPPLGRWDGLARWELRYERQPGSGLRHRRVANVVGVNGTGRFPRGWASNLAWAGKLTRDESEGLVTSGGAQWLHGRVLLEFAGVWDAGVSASVLSGRSLAERHTGLGIEIGRQLPAGTWVSIGYNHFGYRDDELTSEEWTRSGGYLRIRTRFDEALFQRDGRRP
jgi:uncharacterized repeat protein (TIGR01451 family)